MAQTYNDLINGSLRLIGIIGDSETPTSYQTANALFTLNEMLDQWNADGLMIYTTSFYTYNIAGTTASVTIGPGGQIDVPYRPSEIEGAWIRQNAGSSQPIDLPMSVLTPGEWGDVRSKSVSSPIPRFIYLNGDWPTATAYLWPVASAANTTLVLLFNQTLNASVLASDTENLPPAYRQAIRFNLACLLAPEYGREAPPSVQAQAYKSKNLIAQNNQNIDRLEFDSGIQGTSGGSYWIGDDQTR
jgi:hypothetical protein